MYRYILVCSFKHIEGHREMKIINCGLGAYI